MHARATPRSTPARPRPRSPALVLVLLLLSPTAAAPATAAPEPLALSGIHLWLGAGAVAFSIPYVEVGDIVDVQVTVASGGNTGTNASLDLYLGDPSTSAAFASIPFSIGADTTAVVSGPLNTSGLVGIQTVTAKITNIVPPENGPPWDNQASAPLRVHHRVVDMQWNGSTAFEVNYTYPHTGFVTVGDNASLTVRAPGSLSIEQRRDDEYDILVEGNGTLRLTGGNISSAFALGVELRDDAKLIVEGGALLAASVRSSGRASVVVSGARIAAERFALLGGALDFDSAQLDAASASLAGAVVAVRASQLNIGSTVDVTDCPSVLFTDTTVAVQSSFASAGDAEGAFPGITDALAAGEGPYQPAVHLSGFSQASFYRTAASSTVTAAGATMRSTVPLAAVGAAAGTIFRTARVLATDPTGAPVLNSTVEIRHRSNDSVAAILVALNGTAEADLPATLLQSGAAFMLGQYKVKVTLSSTSSGEVPFNFALFPDLRPESLTLVVPVSLPLFDPWVVAPPDPQPRVITNATTWTGDISVSHNIEVRGGLTLSNANLSIDQEHAFEHFVVVTGNGSLVATASHLQSNFPFNIYVLNGSSAAFGAGSAVAANILLAGASSLTLEGSHVAGSVIGDASTVRCTSSFVWSRAVDVSLSSLDGTDCVVAASDLIALEVSGNATLADVALGTTFEPFDGLRQSSLSYSTYGAAASQVDASATGSPAVRLSASHLGATGLTVWTAQPFSLSLGPGASTLAHGRFVAGSVEGALSGSSFSLERSAVEALAPLSFAGSGAVQLRAVLTSPPTVEPAVTLEVYDPVDAHVVDAVGLPVPSAVVRAVPLGGGAPSENATTDEAGMAELLLLTLRQAGGVSSPGPTYRVNASRGGSTSASMTWDASQAGSLEFVLGLNFGAVSGDASFAIVAPLTGGAWRLLASNLANASVGGFLLTFGVAVPAINFTAPVYPGLNATLFVAADFVFSQGPERATMPMAAETAVLAIDGAPAASVHLGDEGSGSASFQLPATAGASAASLAIQAALLPTPLSYSTTITITALPQLHIEATLSKANATFRPSEAITVVGTVKDEHDNTVAGASVTLVYGAGTFSRTNRTASDGSFVFKVLAPTDLGPYTLRISASATDTLSAPEMAIPYQVSTASTVVTPPNSRPGAINLVAFSVAIAMAAAGGLGLLYWWAQRRVARGEFVVCGNCEKPTLATDRKCGNCGVEFEATVAKCSKCLSWISPDADECPQCHTKFTQQVVAHDRDDGPLIPEPSTGVRDGFDIPESVPLTARRADAGRLEDLEFRLPGTTDTLELGEKGGAPTFAGVPSPAPAPPRTRASPPPGDPSLERMELPRVEDMASPVREVSALEGGAPTGKAPVSLGTGNVDLSRTTAAATSTKPDTPVDEDIPEDVLRELLMKAAPELSGDVLPSEIRKELQEIARGEAPAASEKRVASAPKPDRGAPAVPPSERTAEAPEKSKKTAFDVFSKPTKNIPSGYEKKGGPPPKEAPPKGAPVCPNCGGNWVVQRDGKNSCRVCGTRW